ncbi:hypothetical protein VTO73DRAFT_11277 [Trametes versicolor]
MPLLYQHLNHLTHPEGHRNAVTAVEFSPNGRQLASAGLDGRVCIWDVKAGTLLYVFSGQSAILSLLWLESDERLICGMEDGTIATFTICAKRVHLEGFFAHRYPVERLAFDGTYLASGAHKEVKVWACVHEGSWRQVADLRAPRRSSYTTECDIIVTSLHWTSNPSHPLVLLVTYLNHGVAAFDGRTWARIGGTALPGCIADASLTKDGRILAVSNMLTGFELFSLKGFVELEPLFAFQQDVERGGTLHGKVNMWDIYSRLKQPLALDNGVSVLALGAHYDDETDDFFIATGIFNPRSPCSIVLWKTKESRKRRRASASSTLGDNGARPGRQWCMFAGLLVLGTCLGWLIAATSTYRGVGADGRRLM